jgi:hypothetical protein
MTAPCAQRRITRAAAAINSIFSRCIFLIASVARIINGRKKRKAINFQRSVRNRVSYFIVPAAVEKCIVSGRARALCSARSSARNETGMENLCYVYCWRRRHRSTDGWKLSGVFRRDRRTLHFATLCCHRSRIRVTLSALRFLLLNL